MARVPDPPSAQAISRLRRRGTRLTGHERGALKHLKNSEPTACHYRTRAPPHSPRRAGAQLNDGGRGDGRRARQQIANSLSSRRVPPENQAVVIAEGSPSDVLCARPSLRRSRQSLLPVTARARVMSLVLTTALEFSLPAAVLTT